ncbi:hypothetical protein, partial [Pseudomonas sp. Kh7]|uniref:hypothetical protein n=1 Tax=Pseudomonas sp. Kh7 TaxID=2093743 RepID=UPI001C49AD9F
YCSSMSGMGTGVTENCSRPTGGDTKKPKVCRPFPGYWGLSGDGAKRINCWPLHMPIQFNIDVVALFAASRRFAKLL